MKLVVDANVVISAIVRDSVARRLLFHPGLVLYSPAYLFDELEEHRQEIMKKAGLDEQGFTKFIDAIGRVITVLPVTAYAAYVEDAKSVLDDVDDLPYAACAIVLSVRSIGLGGSDVVARLLEEGVDLASAKVGDVDECGIWSNDPDFTRQELKLLQKFGVRVWTTHALHSLLAVR